MCVFTKVELILHANILFNIVVVQICHFIHIFLFGGFCIDMAIRLRISALFFAFVNRVLKIYFLLVCLLGRQCELVELGLPFFDLCVIFLLSWRGWETLLLFWNRRSFFSVFPIFPIFGRRNILVYLRVLRICIVVAT